MSVYKTLSFHQYESDSDSDELIMFSAPAEEIASWAGVPRKGHSIRMLYQRDPNENRVTQIAEFWNDAGTSDGNDSQPFVLGPTAIVLALTESAKRNGQDLTIVYEPPVDLGQDDYLKVLRELATLVLPQVMDRLDDSSRLSIDGFQNRDLLEIPDTKHDYVADFAYRLVLMSKDPSAYVARENLNEERTRELSRALESLCRPALVVDGQHRLLGAEKAKVQVRLPVIAIPRCDWVEQIYQFVVINEKAEKVKTSILTDIFGSSLTPEEQGRLRNRMHRAKVDIEERIAAVIAGRDQRSPFYNMVIVDLLGDPPFGTNPFISDVSIRHLIQGGGRSSRGWRTDDEFYEVFVSPTFPDRSDWDSWKDGAWREYWFAFWHEVAGHYNEQAKKANATELWVPTEITNLTKAVTLRLFQRLFMEKATEKGRVASEKRSALLEILADAPDGFRSAAESKAPLFAIPPSVPDFRTMVRTWFLEKGVPVRVFAKPWVKSLDQSEGQRLLFDELEEAFEKTQAGERYRAQNKFVFEVEDK